MILEIYYAANKNELFIRKTLTIFDLKCQRKIKNLKKRILLHVYLYHIHYILYIRIRKMLILKLISLE